MLATSDGPAVQSIIEEIGSGVSLVDVAPDGAYRFLALNSREEVLRGLRSAECAGKSPLEVLGAEEARREIDGYQRCVGTAAPVEWEQTQQGPGGSRRIRRCLLPLLSGSRVVRVLATSVEMAEPAGPSPLAAPAAQAPDQRTAEAPSLPNQVLRTAFDAIPAFLYLKDKDSRFVMVNQAMEAQLGVSGTELVGLSTHEAPWLSEEGRQRVLQSDRDVIEGNHPQLAEESPFARPGEPVRYYDVIKAPVRTPDGSFEGLVGINLDVTRRREAEEERRRSEELLQTVFDTLPQQLVVKDQEGRYLKVNPAWCDFHGVSGEAVAGRTPAELPQLTEEEARKMAAHDAEAMASERPSVSFESQLRDKNGNLHDIQGIKARLSGADGTPIGLVAVGIDVTESKRAEAELRESQTILQGVFDALPLAVYVKDTESRFLLANKATLRNRGISAEQLPHLATQDMPWVTDEQKQSFLQADRKVIESGEQVDIPELAVSTVDGKLRYYHQIKVPLRDDEGRVTGLVGVSEDITERKRAEAEALARAQDFRALVEGSIQGIAITRGRQMFFANQALAAMFGYETPEEVVALDWQQELVAPADRARLAGYATDRQEGRQAPSRYEFRGLRRDGSEIQAELLASTIQWGGEPAVLATCFDITERRRAEQRLRENEALLRSVVSNAPVVLFALDGSGKITLSEGKGLKGLGLQPGEHVGLSYFDHYRESPALVEETQRALAGEPLHSITQLGAVFFERWLEPVRNAEGAITGVIGVSVDITERRLAERELRENRELLRAVLEALPVWIFVKDTGGHYLLVNRRMCEDLGVSEDGIVQHVVEEVPAFSEHKRREIFGHDAQVLASGETLNLPEVDFDLPGRPRRVHHLIKVPLLDEEEHVRGLVGMAMDITDRIEAHEALQAAMTEIEQLKDRLQAENVYLQDEIKRTHNFEEIVGNSESLQRVLHQVTQVAPTAATVLILGESGTGKELFARAIHNLSSRSARPLVKVNCAALPANMIEAELFGHERGAFTGAVARRAGRFELADGGTVFLDEIGELPLDLQVKLLRVLQEGEFERLGSSQTHKVDVRVIAATNRDLEKAVALGVFREDLYYRLAVFPIRIPPLRDRTGDIPLLARHFTEKFAAQVGKPIKEISGSAMQVLTGYNWPGNVRELQNVVERAVIVTEGTRLILGEGLGTSIGSAGEKQGLASIREQERMLIVRTLEECNWVIRGRNGAADKLNLAASTLRDRMQKYGIRRPR